LKIIKLLNYFKSVFWRRLLGFLLPEAKTSNSHEALQNDIIDLKAVKD